MPKFKVELENCSSVTIDGKKYPVLLHYVRKAKPQTLPATSKERGRPFGVVVALDKNKIGWSICHNVEPWSREEAVKRASGRAMKGYSHWIDKFNNYTTSNGRRIGSVKDSKLPKLTAIMAEMLEMKIRADKYFHG